jgi:phosphinothricin acetyltransferase
MKLVAGDERRHSAAILDIFNEAIVNSVALYDYEPRTMDSMSLWFAGKRLKDYPVICAENDAGEFMGFASYGSFRERPAYKYTVEHSVYIGSRFRGQGVGRALLSAAIAAAGRQDYHVMVGGIDTSNVASIKLHESLGFTHCGTVRQSGFKFGRWLDLALYQKILATPASPVDG